MIALACANDYLKWESHNSLSVYTYLELDSAIITVTGISHSLIYDIANYYKSVPGLVMWSKQTDLGKNEYNQAPHHQIWPFYYTNQMF